MNPKLALTFVIAVVMVAATALSVSTAFRAYAQSTTMPQVDSGNNSTASLNATALDEKNDTGTEEGPGEDADEPGDIDVNDAEDVPK